MSDKLQSSIAIVTLKVAGASVADAEKDLEELVVDTTYNLPSMATIRLYDPHWKWIDGTTFKLGAKLSITLAPAKSMMKVNAGEVFVGEIVALEPTFSSQGTDYLTIRAYDASHRLHIGTKERAFLKATDGDIASKIAREAGLQAGQIVSGGEVHDYVLQNNLTDYEFLSMRARRSGYVLAIVKGKLNFDKPDRMPTGPTLTMGESLRALSLRMSAAGQAGKVVVRGWDIKTKKAVVGTGTPKQLWSKPKSTAAGGSAAKSAFGMTTTTTLTSLAPITTKDAQTIADAAAADQEGHFFEADGVSYGHPLLLAGVQVTLEELGEKYNGKYFVTSATHIFNSAGYETHFTVAGRYPQTINRLVNGGQAGSSNNVGAIYGVVVGIVTNVRDPENLGRVKVTYPWLADTSADAESNWARIASLDAGPQRGFYFLPEVNDEVLVAFEHGNVNIPYIVGRLWNGKDKPPEANSMAHTSVGTVHRMIVTRTGHRIIFDDSKDKQSILIEDATKNQSIFMDSIKNDVVIKSGGNMVIDVKRNLDIKVGGNMTVEATMNLKMTGMNVDVAASSGYIKMDAKTMMDLKAVSMASFVSSAGSMKVQGTMVEVTGSGTVAVKGGLITLN